MYSQMHNPAHPGMLVREYIGERSIGAVAKHIGVARATLSRIVNGSSSITADMSIRLSEAFGVSPDLLLRMQAQYDLWQESQRTRRKIKPLDHAA
ncbi:HigA family addiction module antitoxin [Acidobacterium sp. S8]|uniref:HigA family addiction module antitoxin n=1 Tax=Acidobacterium sp. S8 TaxID=1641854 RepID=UPI001C20669C|nr:HigA family addiction module antitoxin [Acidobacterium sp. S8]